MSNYADKESLQDAIRYREAMIRELEAVREERDRLLVACRAIISFGPRLPPWLWEQLSAAVPAAQQDEKED